MEKSKILTVSAREYVESVGRKLSDYKLVGIQAQRDSTKGTLDEMVKTAPEGTEVITDFRSDGYITFFYGTALVPKK